MQFSALLVSLLLTTAAVAKKNGTEPVSEASQCKEIKGLNALVELAGNSTKLDKVTKNNATKIAEIQAKASAAAPMLQTLQSNTTLMSACAVIDASEMETNLCQETFMLQRFVKFAANTTAVASATKNNATKIANIELNASDAASKLETLTSNSTLQAACPAVMQKDECQAMKSLAKFVAVANNQTKLDKVTKGNTTKEDEIKAKAVTAQDKLTAMQGNATFVAACDALDKNSEKGTETGSSTASTSSTAVKSAAFILKGASAAGLMGSTMRVVFVGMLML
jgi:hypothetical protein